MGCGASRKTTNIDSFHASINTKSDVDFKRNSLRLVLAGPSGVGKTRFFKTFQNDPNNPYRDSDKLTDYSNVKDNVYNKVIILEKGRINLTLWDLAGSADESIKVLTRNFFRHSDGVLLLFDMMNPKSLEVMDNQWLPFINDTLDFNIVRSREQSFLYTCSLRSLS